MGGMAVGGSGVTVGGTGVWGAAVGAGVGTAAVGGGGVVATVVAAAQAASANTTGRVNRILHTLRDIFHLSGVTETWTACGGERDCDSRKIAGRACCAQIVMIDG